MAATERHESYQVVAKSQNAKGWLSFTFRRGNHEIRVSDGLPEMDGNIQVGDLYVLEGRQGGNARVVFRKLNDDDTHSFRVDSETIFRWW